MPHEEHELEMNHRRTSGVCLNSEAVLSPHTYDPAWIAERWTVVVEAFLVHLQLNCALLAAQFHIPAGDQRQAQVCHWGAKVLQEGTDVVPESACVSCVLPLNPWNPSICSTIHLELEHTGLSMHWFCWGL